MSIYKDPNLGYPTKLKEIAGKSFIFNVEICDDNVKLKSKIFHVADAYDNSYFASSPKQETMVGSSLSNSSDVC